MAIFSLKNKEVLSNLTAPANIDLGAMIPIATVTVGSGGSSSITFSDIPQNYEHLQIRLMLRDGRNYGRNDIYMQVGNSTIDTGTNYSWHRLYGDGSSAASNAGSTQSYMSFATLCANTAPANTFGVAIVDILNYADTNKYKTIRALAGGDNNNTAEPPYISLDSGLWRSTSAINQIKIYDETSSNFLQYSHFALYGIKRAGA